MIFISIFLFFITNNILLTKKKYIKAKEFVKYWKVNLDDKSQLLLINYQKKNWNKLNYLYQYTFSYTKFNNDDEENQWPFFLKIQSRINHNIKILDQFNITDLLGLYNGYKKKLLYNQYNHEAYKQIIKGYKHKFFDELKEIYNEKNQIYYENIYESNFKNNEIFINSLSYHYNLIGQKRKLQNIKNNRLKIDEIQLLKNKNIINDLFINKKEFLQQFFINNYEIKKNKFIFIFQSYNFLNQVFKTKSQWKNHYHWFNMVNLSINLNFKKDNNGKFNIAPLNPDENIIENKRFDITIAFNLDKIFRNFHKSIKLKDKNILNSRLLKILSIKNVINEKVYERKSLIHEKIQTYRKNILNIFERYTEYYHKKLQLNVHNSNAYYGFINAKNNLQINYYNHEYNYEYYQWNLFFKNPLSLIEIS